MKIYTKTGDKGETSLFGGKRVTKDALRIEAYGTVDELNSMLGVCRSLNSVQEIDSILNDLQQSLFTLGADLATPSDVQNKSVTRIQETDIRPLEHTIDSISEKLQPLTSFILPGGNRAAAMIHLARTVCRRAERLVVQLSHEEEINRESIVFLNRLSDLLFVLARYVNALSNTSEVKWNS
ncbi:MAG: cob(I)yrinic acid a,c-diamide adenosyltransferase [Ignavibacteriae bacterium]|nr:cob(I)yrinic acid a,c-diamide adenosyltransferase [Ignavibacteriota bacterium]